MITVLQVGNNVVATGEGTLNTTGLSSTASTGDESEEGYFYPYFGDFSVGGGPVDEFFSVFRGVRGPDKIGNGVSTWSPNTNSGGPVGIYGESDGDILYGGGALVVPFGYDSGSYLSDSSTYFNVTFSNLGLTPETYTWTWGSGATADSLELQIGIVPEPSGTALLVMALGTIGLYAWLRRRRGAIENAFQSPMDIIL